MKRQFSSITPNAPKTLGVFSFRDIIVGVLLQAYDIGRIVRSDHRSHLLKIRRSAGAGNIFYFAAVKLAGKDSVPLSGAAVILKVIVAQPYDFAAVSVGHICVCADLLDLRVGRRVQIGIVGGSS